MLTRSRRSRCVAVAVLQKLRLEFSVERPKDVRYTARSRCRGRWARKLTVK